MRWSIRVVRAQALWLSLVVPGLIGCGSTPALPPAERAANEYLDALERGDWERARSFMNEESKRMLSRKRLERMGREQSEELKAYVSDLKSKGRVVSTSAQVRLANGELVSLKSTEAGFAVSAAAGLPAAARTPAQACAQLATVLRAGSYQRLLQLLTESSRAGLENTRRSLVEGLSEPETLVVKVKGDRATVMVPGGHRVSLRLNDGVWRVEDFE